MTYLSNGCASTVLLLLREGGGWTSVWDDCMLQESWGRKRGWRAKFGKKIKMGVFRFFLEMEEQRTLCVDIHRDW